jgi:hypothetical protein
MAKSGPVERRFLTMDQVSSCVSGEGIVRTAGRGNGLFRLPDLAEKLGLGSFYLVGENWLFETLRSYSNDPRLPSQLEMIHGITRASQERRDEYSEE